MDNTIISIRLVGKVVEVRFAGGVKLLTYDDCRKLMDNLPEMMDKIIAQFSSEDWRKYLYDKEK